MLEDEHGVVSCSELPAQVSVNSSQRDRCWIVRWFVFRSQAQMPAAWIDLRVRVMRDAGMSLEGQ